MKCRKARPRKLILKKKTEQKEGFFKPFKISEDMTLAPVVPSVAQKRFNRGKLDAALKLQDDKIPRYLQILKSGTYRHFRNIKRQRKPRLCDADAIFADTNIETSLHLTAKLLKFCENVRPPYWGTWSKKSRIIRPRNPFGQDDLFDYSVNSDDEWEGGPSESLSVTEMYAELILKEPEKICHWIKYAQWEESQNKVKSARSVYEKALYIHRTNVSLWLNYAKMEMNLREVDSARRIFNKVVNVLPRNNYFWNEHVEFEIMTNEVATARAIFERWMNCKPDWKDWLTYIKFELKFIEIEKAKVIYGRFVRTHPRLKEWFSLKIGQFQTSNDIIRRSIIAYEKAIALNRTLNGVDYHYEKVFTFAAFEENQDELVQLERRIDDYDCLEIISLYPQFDMPDYIWKDYLTSLVHEVHHSEIKNKIEQKVQYIKGSRLIHPS